MRYFFCFVFGNPGGVLAARSRPVFRTGGHFSAACGRLKQKVRLFSERVGMWLWYILKTFTPIVKKKMADF